MSKSRLLFEQAVNYIPGGVNSPVRAFSSVGNVPPFIKKADGARLYDVDGNSYVDLVCSWGPMILGHNHPDVLAEVKDACENGLSFGAVTESEVEMASLVCEMVPSVEMVRMVNSGTEAVMSALRLARAYTHKDKLVKFSGCYHGHVDAMLVKAGSGVMQGATPNSAGIPSTGAKDTLIAQYNDTKSLSTLFKQHKDEIAAVIIEPVAANMGLITPKDTFLQEVRKLCTQNKALLIFDEVITGFRLDSGGAQKYFNIEPDLTILGKIIGGGMPVGAFGGKKSIMEMLAPIGPVYQAGTLSGNPVAMAAGRKQLQILKDNESFYTDLNKKGDAFFMNIKDMINDTGVSCCVNHIGSLGCIYFLNAPVENYDDAKQADTIAFGKFHRYMLENGIYMAPSQFESVFLSAAHTQSDLDRILTLMRTYFMQNKNEG